MTFAKQEQRNGGLCPTAGCLTFLLDTNIIVDIISKRKGYENSLSIMRFCELNRVKCFVSTVTVNDVMYILRKHISPDSVRGAVQTLLLIVDVADVVKSDISNAFASDWKDFEDSVQASCAKRIGADYIVTNNTKDFTKSVIPAILPSKAKFLLQ